MYQKAIGDLNIERKLDKLAEDPRVQESLRLMQGHIRSGMRDHDASLYFHNKKIANIFDRARKEAWATILQQPAVQDLIEIEKQKNIRDFKIEKQSRNLVPVLSMYK